MKTISFEVLINEKDYERPDHKDEDIVVEKIEEINVSDSINGKKLALPVDRGYKIYWKNKNGELKFWTCGLGSQTYKKYVLPNILLHNDRR